MNNDAKHLDLVPAIVTGVFIVGGLFFLNFYKTDSSASIATSSCSAVEIVVVMEKTKHIRFVEELGVTPSGRTLFSYRRVDYGIFDVFACYGEVDAVSEILDMKIVKR